MAAKQMRSLLFNNAKQKLRCLAYTSDQKISQFYKTSHDRFNTLPIVLKIVRILIEILPRYSPVALNALLHAGNNLEVSDAVWKHLNATHDGIKSWEKIKHAMRHSLIIGDSALASEIYDNALARGVTLPAAAPKRLNLIKGNITEYLQAFRHSPKKKPIKKYFASKYVEIDEIEDVLFSGKEIVILSTLGPGDELAFSFIYSAMIEDNRVDVSKIKIVCDHRFYDLFTRSYPGFTFISSKRSRHITRKYPYRVYNELPHCKLHKLLCNESLQKIQNTEKYLFNLDLLMTYAYKLGGTPHKYKIKSDAKKVRKFRDRLPKDKKLVGVSWRSGLSSIFRNFNYLSIEEISPIFEVDEVLFVNLQYDECDEEVAWVEKHFPNKLITLTDLDMYDDFDSVVSLMECLDYIISSTTTVCELSAMSQNKTLMISNVREVSERVQANGKDLWHSSVIHISGDKFEDKPSLVRNLKAYLENNADQMAPKPKRPESSI